MCVRPTSPSDRPVLTRRPTAPHPELRRLGGSRRWPATTCPSSRVRPDAPAARTARAARVAFRRSVSFSHGATRQAQVGRRFRPRHDPRWMPNDNWQEESAFPFFGRCPFSRKIMGIQNVKGRFFPSRRDEKKSREAFFFFRRLFFSRSRRRRRANVARSFVSPRRLNLLTFHAPSKNLESRRGGASDPHAAVAHGEETPQREGPHGRGRV